MSTGSPIKTLSRIAVCTFISAWMAGCSNNSTTSAPISSVNGGGNSGNSSQNTLNSNPQMAPAVGPGGHIVYNRSYNSIPKGSYSGSTYQVKRGDTLFYIAWITGNDFRDLAARNNIPAPYSLEVGQTVQINNVSSAASTSSAPVVTDATNGGVPKVPTGGMLAGSVVASQPTTTYSDSSGKQNVGKMLPSSGAVTTTTTPVAVASTPVATSDTVKNFSEMFASGPVP